MALKECKECGGKVSTEATQCPHCGAVLKKPRQSIGCGGLFLIFIIIVSLSSIFGSNDKKAAAPKTKAELRTEKLAVGFSAWDGSHRALEKIIKAGMNDPKSYEHEETTYSDKGDHLIVKTVYRGKNAYGGVVKGWITAKPTIGGQVVNIIDQGP